jgi:hypothetical protein
MKLYLIYKGNLRSLNHTGFRDKSEAEAEASRINQAIIQDNNRIDKNPATGRGSAFMNLKREPNFNVREVEI